MLSAWNALPEVVVAANALVAFKRFLDRHIDIQVIDGYELCAGRCNCLVIVFCTDIVG